MSILINLPNDIIHEKISQFLNFNNLRLLNTTNNLLLNDFYKKKILSKLITNSNKIKLYYKLLISKHFLFNTLKKSFNVPFGECVKLNNYCLIYSPIVQYGTCRFCNEHLHMHKYTKMINIYLNIRSRN